MAFQSMSVQEQKQPMHKSFILFVDYLGLQDVSINPKLELLWIMLSLQENGLWLRIQFLRHLKNDLETIINTLLWEFRKQVVTNWT